MYFAFFRFSLFIYCIVTRKYGTKMAGEESAKFLWSTKSNPIHEFSFDNKVTFSRCSVDKKVRNNSGRENVKDNKCTKVSMSTQ